ncbi:uncharacterized protein [Panulirus ornatus]|uniref:uncharacterized protein n=1 Tax=Panulirus ornatus TaxID=150431 RepID=UPI003A8780FF
MLQKTRLLLFCATVCSAQTGGPRDTPAAAPPSPPATSGHDVPAHPTPQCAPGDLLPGPTCTSFLMCVTSGNSATRRVKFECGPGTIFSPDLSTCVHSYGLACPTDGPATPVPGPSPSLPSPAPPDVAGNEETELCPPYKLDPTSVFECLEPGSYPSLADCVSFYKCIVTMDCFIKGFLFRCPPGYHFDRISKRCLKEELLGRCDRVADAGAQSFQIKPVVEIQPESFDEFFQAERYWDFMPFLPNETQTIVPVTTFAFARASSGEVYLTSN